MFSAAIQLGASNALHHYRPLAVTAALRGFASEDSQLRVSIASEDEAVSITGCVARKCPTGRDLYFERRFKLDTPNWERHVIGKVVDSLLGRFHQVGLQCLEDAFEKATLDKDEINLEALATELRAKGEEIARSRLVEEWEYPGTRRDLKDVTIDAFAEHIAGKAGGQELLEKTLDALNDLIRHETEVLIGYIRSCRRRGRIRDFIKGRPGQWMAEVRSVLARLQSEVKLDDSKHFPARALGLSGNVKPDVLYAVTLVGDVKSGIFHEYYRLVATGYAIFVEYALNTRVNTAAIIAVDLDLKAGKLRSLDVIPIQPDDEERRRWMAMRNGAIAVLRNKTPPPHPTDLQECPSCHYRNECWADGKVGGTAITPSPPEKVAPAPAKKDAANLGEKPREKSRRKSPNDPQLVSTAPVSGSAKDLQDGTIDDGPDKSNKKAPDAT